jgi:hypothetical protein
MLPPEEPIYSVLVPYCPEESISLKEAAGIAGLSVSTVRSWCKEHGLGRRVAGGRWRVSRVALSMFLDEDLVALATYHQGDRSSGLVRPYFERNNVPL